MLRPWVFVGFTGHRALANPALARKGIAEALDRCGKRADAPLATVSSAASGADALFVAEALRRDLPWFLLLPFPEEEFRRDFSEADWAVTAAMLPQAKGRHVETTGPVDAEARTRAFQDCSGRTVDECEILIACWNGEAGKPGGTGETVAYARQQNKPLLIVDPATGAVTEENLDQLERVGTWPPVAIAPSAAADGRAVLKATLDAHDAPASAHGLDLRKALTLIIGLHLFGTVIGLLGPVYDSLLWFTTSALASGLLVWLTGGAKIIALGYAEWIGHRQHHRKDEWLRHRFAAELCRSALATWDLRHSDRLHQALAVPGFRPWQRTLCRWHLFHAAAGLGDLEKEKAAYIKDRIEDQIRYFRKHLDRAEAMVTLVRRTAKIATRSAIVLGLVVLAMSVGSGAHAESYNVVKASLKYLSLALPLATGFVLSWLISQDALRRASRNRDMIDYLESTRRQIQRATTREAFNRTVADAETMFLLEILEFNSVSRFASEEH